MHFRKIIYLFLRSAKSFNFCSFLETTRARSSKLFVMITSDELFSQPFHRKRKVMAALWSCIVHFAITSWGKP